MPNEAKGSLDKRTNRLESVAQVSPQKSGPYDLMKSEAASTKVVLPIRLGKILNITLIEVLGSRCKYQHCCEVWMVRYSPQHSIKRKSQSMEYTYGNLEEGNAKADVTNQVYLQD